MKALHWIFALTGIAIVALAIHDAHVAMGPASMSPRFYVLLGALGGTQANANLLAIFFPSTPDSNA